MFKVETVVRLDGAIEQILQMLLHRGYYKTKAEAIRAGILELGKEYALVGSPEADLVIKRIEEMKAEVKEGKKKIIPFDEVAKKIGAKS